MATSSPRRGSARCGAGARAEGRGRPPRPDQDRAQEAHRGSRRVNMAERTRRLLLGVVLPIVILGLAVLPWIVGWGDLPATVATHFDAGGAADGSASSEEHTSELQILIRISY